MAMSRLCLIEYGAHAVCTGHLRGNKDGYVRLANVARRISEVEDEQRNH